MIQCSEIDEIAIADLCRLCSLNGYIKASHMSHAMACGAYYEVSASAILVGMFLDLLGSIYP